MMNKPDDYKEKIPFWNNLNDNEKELVKSSLSIVEFKENSLINACEVECLGMFYVIKGTVRVCLISEEGREITIYRVEKDDSCCIAASCVLKSMTLTIEALTAGDVELLVIGANAYSQLTEMNIYVKSFTYEIITKRLSAALWVMQEIVFERFDNRLASFLLAQYEKTGNSEIKMTQEIVAREVNSAREVVARMLKRFTTDGLVEVKRGSINLTDIEGLKMLK